MRSSLVTTWKAKVTPCTGGPTILSIVNAQLEEEEQRSDSFQSPMGFSALTKFPQFLFFHPLVELSLPLGEKIWLLYHYAFVCPLVDKIDEIDC